MSEELKVAIIGSTGRGDYGHALDEAWNARFEKLRRLRDNPSLPSAARPDHWWSFQLASR